MRRKTIALRAAMGMALSLLALLLVVNLTNPSGAGPLGMLAVLLLIYVFSYSIVVGLAMVSSYVYQLIVLNKYRRPVLLERQQAALRKSLAICAVYAATPMLLFSLNSLGQISLVDIILIATIELVAVFYISRKLS